MLPLVVEVVDAPKELSQLPKSKVIEQTPKYRV